MTQQQAFSKSVSISKHAIDRAVERLGVQKEHAENHIRQLLAVATYHGESANAVGKADVFLHRNTGVTIIVGRDDKTVSTVYKAENIPTNKIL